MLSIWSKNNTLFLHGLSEDPLDGTAEEQCTYLQSGPFTDRVLLSSNYLGVIPASPQETWEWNGASIVANAEKVRLHENTSILVQIAEKEKQEGYPRGLREFMLEQPGASAKPWFVKVKAVDDAISALRAQLK